MKNLIKIDTQEAMEFLVVVNSYKPAFSITKVLVLDDDSVLAVNGSDSYIINFIEDLEAVINETEGNIGWGVCPNKNGKTHLDLVCEKLYENDYIGDHKASL